MRPILILLFLLLCRGVAAEESASLTPPGRPVEVKAEFYLLDLNEINEEAETFEFNGILTLRWRDPRQRFKPEENNGRTEKIYQGNFQFDEISPSWYPQIVLSNQSGLYETQGVILRVTSDGECTLRQTISAIAETDLNLRRYPFDRQTLKAVFEVFGFDNSEVILQENDQKVPLQNDVEISQWKISKMRLSTGSLPVPYAGNSGTTSSFEVTIDVEREPLFTVRQVIMPLILIVMLSWSVFWMDRSSLGDRINVSFIGILTAVAYQIVVADLLPHISYVTFLNAFLNLSLLMMSATVVINLRVGALDQQGRQAAGDIIDKRCRWAFPLSYFGILSLIFTLAMLLF